MTSITNLQKIVQMRGTKTDIESGNALLEEGAFSYSSDTNELGVYTSGIWKWVGTEGTIDAFTDLTDTFETYSGLGGMYIRVKSTEDGLETNLPSGSGDVVGPSSATDGNLAVFDGTTGKLIKDGGAPSGVTIVYPTQIEVPVFFPSASSGSLNRNTSNNHILYGRIYTTAQNNYMEYPVLLCSGTWSLDVMTDHFTDRAIHTVTIDGTSWGTYDCYAASAAYNQIHTLTGLSVSTTGVKLLRFTAATKHASSTNYTLLLQMAVLTRTGD